jgi:glutamyl-tRNA synthetase
MNKKIRTRFAPSPTGLLHIGGVRTALFAYLFAKSQNGQFVLRLEDTDRERFVEDGVEQIIKSLDWLGIHPDEGVWYEEKLGKHGPYIQSERLPHYQKYARQLVEKGLAYYSAITPEAFASLREASIAAKKPFVYKQTMEPTETPQDTAGLPIRLKIGEGTTKWNDEIRGESETPNELIDDFVIMKADGFPTYNFANVIDDHLMEISHVIRGDEFLSSTAKHAILFDMLGFERPCWVHLPLILGPDGKKKLSKRDGDVDVLEYKAKGYLPETLVNFLALLGWNDGTEQEIFSMDELVSKFSINRVQKSPAVLDMTRLDWMNGEYIRAMSLSELSGQIRPFIPAEWYDKPKYFEKVLALDKDRMKRLDEAKYIMEIFFETPVIDISLLTKKANKTQVNTWLKAVAKKLEGTAFDNDTLEKTLRDLVDELELHAGQLFSVIRISLTGREQAPGLFDILATLGKEESLKRIEAVISLT